MNERIKQLLSQAHTDSTDIKDTNWIANRFASLIIEECSEYLRINGGAFLVQGLKERFGIEQ